MEKVITFFTQIQKIVFSEKNSFLNLIDQNTQKIITEQDSSHQLVNRYSNELQKFISDIDLNFDNIVHDMEMEPFKDIMSTYENRLSEIEQQIQEIPKKFRNSELLIENEQVFQKIREIIQNGLYYQESGNYNQFDVIQSIDKIAIPSIGNSPQFNQLTMQTQKSQESEQLRQTMNIKQSNETDFVKMFKTSNESDYCQFQKYVKQNEEIIMDQIEESPEKTNRNHKDQSDNSQKLNIKELENNRQNKTSNQNTQITQDTVQDIKFNYNINHINNQNQDYSNQQINNKKVESAYERSLKMQNRPHINIKTEPVDNVHFKNKLQVQLQKHKDQTKKSQLKIQLNCQKPTVYQNLEQKNESYVNLNNNTFTPNNSNGMLNTQFISHLQPPQNQIQKQNNQFQIFSDKK